MNFIDLQRQYKEYKNEIDLAIQNVLNSSRYVFGQEINTLEKTLADYCGVNYAIACSSGTDALMLALMALGLKQGDEIITTPFTFIASAEIPALLGLKPVFVDIDEKTYNINPELIESAITDKTKAIIAVDIFGQAAEFEEIEKIAEKYGLFVIEDAAQSFGAEHKNKNTCSFGDLSITSFFPAKPLGCYGDGGMVFTDDTDYAEKMVSFRNHGQGAKYEHKYIGINARLDSIQAAILLEKFKHYEIEIDLRQQKAEYYIDNLKDFVTTPYIKDYNKSVYAQFSIYSENRQGIINSFTKDNIPFAIHYPVPLHLQPCFEYLGYKKGAFPVAEKISSGILSLPMFAHINEREQSLVIDSVIKGIKK